MKKNKSNTQSKINTKKSQVSTRTGIERMFKILGFLQNGHIHSEPINCKTLGAILEVDRATVMRDIAFLRDRMGVEFEWDADDNSYRLYGDTKFLPSMELDEIDKLVLEFMSQSINALNGSELGAAMQKSFQRMFGIFTGKYPKNGWKVPAELTKKTGASELRIYHIATRAIRAGKKIKVTLHNVQGAVAALEVSPNGIEFNGSQWVMKAVSTISQESLCLKFDEVAQIDISHEQVASMPKLWSDPQAKNKPLFASVDGVACLMDAPLRAA
ncbi:MAG: helix-turn-helix transcriptional regulator [Spartobacteria bacterium]